jgi:RNA polymerase sigma-70 factor (ECF subfamily)
MNEVAGLWPGAWVSDEPSDAAGSEDREALLAEAAPLAFRVAFAVLRHRQDAEDVAQEALAQAWSRFHTLRDRDRFRSWLARIAWRRALDRRRAQGRRGQHEAAAIPSSPPTPEELAAGQERADLVWRAVDALPGKLRIVVVMAGLLGHDVREVAALLSLPEGTVKSRLYLARRALAARLR